MRVKVTETRIVEDGIEVRGANGNWYPYQGSEAPAVGSFVNVSGPVEVKTTSRAETRRLEQ